MLMGELSLDGTLQPIRGVLPMAILARELGFKGLRHPKATAPEAPQDTRIQRARAHRHPKGRGRRM